MSGYGISPNVHRWAKDLTDKEKLILIEISCLSAENGFCFASNEYIGERLSCDKNTISRYMSSLKDKGYISIDLNNPTGNNTKRKVYLLNGNTYTKMSTSPLQICSANIYNNLLKEIREYKETIKGGDFGGDINKIKDEISSLSFSLDGQVTKHLKFNLPSIEEVGPVGAILLAELKALENGESSINLYTNLTLDAKFITDITNEIVNKGVTLERIPKHGEISKDTMMKIKNEFDNMLTWYRGDGRVVKNLRSTTQKWFTRFFADKRNW